MLIECKNQRKGGVEVDFGTISYHFMQDAWGRFVAEVTDSAHIAKLLSLADGYRQVDPIPSDGSSGGGATTFSALGGKLLSSQVPSGGVAGQFLGYNGEWDTPPKPSGGASGQFWGWDGSWRFPPSVSPDNSINPIEAPYNAAGDFNLTTKSGTADNAAVQAAMNAAAAQGKILRITRVHRLAQTNVGGAQGAAGDVRIPEGLVMVCDPGCGFAYDGMILPALWKEGAGKFVAYDLTIYFFGTIPIDQPPHLKYATAYANFSDNITTRAKVPLTVADRTGGYDAPGVAMYLLGGDITLVRPKWKALVAEGTALEGRQYIFSCMYLTSANNGAMPTMTVIDPEMDGYHMGFSGSSWKDVTIVNPIWRRYGGGSIDAGWAYTPPPRHAIYNTGGEMFKARRGRVTVINPMDYGIDHSEVGGLLNSLKFNGSSKVVVRGGFSYCPHGSIAGVCEDWDVTGYSAICDYTRHAFGTNSGKAISFFALNYNSDDGGAAVQNGGSVAMRLRMTGAAPGSCLGTDSGKGLSISLDLSVEAVTGLGLWVANSAVTGCTLKVKIQSDTPGVISSLGTLNGASIGNRVEAQSYDLTNILTGNLGQLRVIENTDKANAYNNTMLVTDLGTGSTVEVLANGLAILRRTKVVTQAANSGASVTIAGLIPAGARNVALSAVVTTALGATNGTTGFSAGVSGDTARFGSVTGVAVGSGGSGTLAPKAQTAAAPWQYAAATDVILTAVGGNFDGTGVIQLTLYYETTSQSNQAY